MEQIHKISAMVIQDNKLLMVKKVGKQTWTTLGGKPEEGETEEEALHREINEEIHCNAKIIKKLDDFVTDAHHHKGFTVKLSTYLVELLGEINLDDPELEKADFIPKEYEEKGIKLPPSMTEQVIPFLKKEGLIDW